ncbi:DUF7000 family protein [Thaumasiovibrio subtropicus]|uniref:DUF7000 family protein n=1 Tax=Thaumasiovibrio subtropicus TaxID=1891207 RepID=UPI001864D51F|nr:hypothetical protein [Thaumasiovibrio subtropicus]
MMEKPDLPETLGALALHYQRELQDHRLHRANMQLIQFLGKVKAHFLRETTYQCGNISPGYLDYSYFAFFNTALRANKLRFGIVLNHHALRFELWLMGQNADMQHHYWSILKASPWNVGFDAMPIYSVLETVLVESPNFDRPEQLIKEIEATATLAAEEIMMWLTPHLEH